MAEAFTVLLRWLTRLFTLERARMAASRAEAFGGLFFLRGVEAVTGMVGLLVGRGTIAILDAAEFLV